MDPSENHLLRQQLVKHLKGGEAFLPLEQFIHKMPWEKAGIVPEGLPYSFWQQLWHMRFAQLDILDFSRDTGYSAPAWPADYWPADPAPASEQEWKAMIDAFFNEQDELIKLVLDPEVGLFEPFPHGTGQTVLREALLVIEHSAYHTSQMLIILRLLGLYK